MDSHEKYPWEMDNVGHQCFSCRKYNFRDRYGTGPLSCIVYPRGMSYDKIINKEACDDFEENHEPFSMTIPLYQPHHKR